MSTWVLIAATALLVAVVLGQVTILRFGAGRIERRLAQHGGEAFVSIDALPALRLLRRRGDRLLVRGHGLTLGISGSGGLSALDGFRSVDIALREFTIGPFEVSSFELSRERRGPYRMRSAATTSGLALASYGGEQLGGLVPLLVVLARQAPLGDRGIPLSIEVEMLSEDGLISVSSGGGSIAGYPAGPIATLIAGAVARDLEISY
jgi:hypothetical protein